MEKYLRTGSRIELKVPYVAEDEETLTLHARYEETLSDTDFVVEAPFYKGTYYPLPVNTPLDLFFFNRSVPHSFTAVALKRYAQDGMNFIVMRREGEVQRHQMRESFRIACHIRAYTRINGGAENPVGSTIPCQIVNISYGGARVALSQPLEVSSQVELMFSTTVDETIPCEVRSVVPSESGSSQYKWWGGLMFHYTDPAQSRRGAKMINQMEHDMLKSGRDYR